MAIQHRILAMRHPETLANTEHFFSGRRDVALTERGEYQRKRAVDALQAFAPDRIWCSPLSRCADLAAMAAARLGIEAEVVDDLVEIEFGVLEGTHFKGAFQGDIWQFPWPLDENGHSMPAEGAESFEHVSERAQRVLDRLRPLSGRTALVTHGGFSRVLLATIYGMPLDRFWYVHLFNASSAFYTCNGKDFYLGGFNLSPDEVIARATTTNEFDTHDLWGVQEREQA